jgi:hypothetical protein
MGLGLAWHETSDEIGCRTEFRLAYQVWCVCQMTSSSPLRREMVLRTAECVLLDEGLEITLLQYDF